MLNRNNNCLTARLVGASKGLTHGLRNATVDFDSILQSKKIMHLFVRIENNSAFHAEDSSTTRKNIERERRKRINMKIK